MKKLNKFKYILLVSASTLILLYVLLLNIPYYSYGQVSAACVSSSSIWKTITMTPQSGTFNVEFDAIPTTSSTDTVMGLSSSAVNTYGRLAIIVRFAPTGFIDARNGPTYQAASSIPYIAANTYHFHLVINTSAHTYSAYVKPSGGSQLTIGTNYAFRTEQANASSLPIFNIYSANGIVNICDLHTYSESTTPTIAQNPTPTISGNCPLKAQGDADCKKDSVGLDIGLADFNIWRSEKFNGCSVANPTGCGADEDGDGNVMDSNFNFTGSGNLPVEVNAVVDSIDYNIWRSGYFSHQGIPTPTNTGTITPAPIATVTVGPSPTLGPTIPPGQGIWISQSEIAKLPMSGPGWADVKTAADGSWGTANLSDNNSDHDVDTLAGALVAARTGDSAMRQKTIAGLQSAMNSPLSRALELGRGLQSYVIAADIINYHDAAFEAWVRKMLNANISGHSGDGLLGTARNSSNNWGGHARASVIASALYLHDTALLNEMANTYKAFIGISAPNTLVYSATNWHAGSPEAGVNVKGATGNGHDLSGIIAEDWRRGGEYKWPPVKSGYMWEAMQGFVVSAVLLHRANLVPFSSADNAVVRAITKLYEIQYPPAGDDTWIPWVVNYYGGTLFSTGSVSSPGKNMGWTSWTHAK